MSNTGIWGEIILLVAAVVWKICLFFEGTFFVFVCFLKGFFIPVYMLSFKFCWYFLPFFVVDLFFRYGVWFFLCFFGLFSYPDLKRNFEVILFYLLFHLVVLTTSIFFGCFESRSGYKDQLSLVFTKSHRSLAVCLMTGRLTNSPTLHLYTGPIYRVIWPVICPDEINQMYTIVAPFQHRKQRR